MNLPVKQRSVTTLIVIPSVIIVIALAALQYRWSARVSEATAVRLADSLQMSLMNWQKDFFRYFSEIALALRIDPLEDTPEDVSQYVRRLAEWKALAKYPDLISGVYLLGRQESAFQMNPSNGRFEPKVWPGQFAPIRKDLAFAAANFLRKQKEPAAAPESFGIGDPAAGWKFDPNIPALFHPIILKRLPFQDVSWLAIELNQQEIQQRVLSDLSHTYFQGTDGLDYQIAVIARGTPNQVLYSSDAGFGEQEPADADGIIDIFGRSYDQSVGPAVHIFHAPSDDKGPSVLARISWFPLLRQTPLQADWRLVVRHRRGGPLGAFVTELHRRDLAIGFGVLLVLAVNMGMLIVTSHRAQRLAQLQMNFVTAVSHELRTPLTVIISGAENICNGVVDSTQQMVHYGSVIGSHAKQLYALVERILLFASTRQGRQLYALRALDVEDAIDSALASVAQLVEARSFAVERAIPRDLPPVLADASALSQCLQNLITNALKYSKEQRWIGIQAAADDHEMQLSVSDRGMGIKSSDLPHIFEPFYRSPSVQAAQIHGTGLGLALSKSLIEDMKGRISVSSTPGKGSTFTIHLRIAAKQSAVAGQPNEALSTQSPVMKD